MHKAVEVKIESNGMMIDNVNMDSTGKYPVNPNTYLLEEGDMGDISIDGNLILCNYDGYNLVVKMMANNTNTSCSRAAERPELTKGINMTQEKLTELVMNTDVDTRVDQATSFHLGRIDGILTLANSLGYEASEGELNEWYDIYKDCLSSNVFTSPKYHIELILHKEINIIEVVGFGRWQVEIMNDKYFATGFILEEGEQTVFESLSFFWYDWMEDVCNTKGIIGSTFMFETICADISNKLAID